MERYHVLELIGEGSYGKVFKARLRGTGQLVALKFLPREGPVHLDDLRAEIEISKSLDHPHIIKMLDCFQTEDQLCLVLEYAFGDLFSILQTDNQLPEDTVKIIGRQLVHALYYLHQKRIIHRDMKLQNILVCDNSIVKLCDFGFARCLSKHTAMVHSIKGTPLYMAPELLLEEPYNHTVDLWSLGVILYELFAGHPPFYSDKILDLLSSVVNKEVTYPEAMSSEFKSLLEGLLQKDPKKRLDYPQILNHPFFMESDQETVNGLFGLDSEVEDISEQWENNHCFQEVFKLLSESTLFSKHKVLDNQQMESINRLCFRLMLECQIEDLEKVVLNIVDLMKQKQSTIEHCSAADESKCLLCSFVYYTKNTALRQFWEMKDEGIERLMQLLTVLLNLLYKTPPHEQFVEHFGGAFKKSQLLRSFLEIQPKGTEDDLKWFWTFALEVFHVAEDRVHNEECPLHIRLLQMENSWFKETNFIWTEVQSCFSLSYVHEAVLLGIKNLNETLLKVLFLITLTPSTLPFTPKEVIEALIYAPLSAWNLGILTNILQRKNLEVSLDFSKFNSVAQKMRTTIDLNIKTLCACVFHALIASTARLVNNIQFDVLVRELTRAVLDFFSQLHQLDSASELPFSMYITGHLVLLKDMLQVKLEDLLTTKETQKCILIIQHHFLETPSIEKLPKEGVAASLEILLLLHKRSNVRDGLLWRELLISTFSFLEAFLKCKLHEVIFEDTIQKLLHLFYFHFKLSFEGSYSNSLHLIKVIEDVQVVKILVQSLGHLQFMDWDLPVYILAKLTTRFHQSFVFLKSGGLSFSCQVADPACSLFTTTTWLFLLNHLVKIQPELEFSVAEKFIIPYLQAWLCHPHEGIRSKACCIVGNLCRHSDRFYTLLSIHDIPKTLLHCCADVDCSTRRFACFAVGESMVLGNAAYHNARLYTELGVGIPLLVQLIVNEMDDRTRSNAAAAIGNLSRHGDSLCEVMITSKVIPVLLDLVLESSRRDSSDEKAPWTALYTLGNLCSYAICRQEAVGLDVEEVLNEVRSEKLVEVRDRVIYKMC